MTPEEKFMFDLEGYLVVRNVLSKEEVDQCNEVADRIARDQFEIYRDDGLKLARNITLWDPCIQSLIDHPKIVPYLIELLGPSIHFDQDYCIFLDKGGSKGPLHAGTMKSKTELFPFFYTYHDGIMRNGLTTLVYALTPVRKGDGGFCCIPGSHKSNFQLDIPEDVMYFRRPAHYVVQPELEPGDLIIFTEATVHGTMPWTANHERRSFLFKYNPGNTISWANYYNIDDYDHLTENQKRMMSPPGGQGPTKPPRPNVIAP